VRVNKNTQPIRFPGRRSIIGTKMRHSITLIAVIAVTALVIIGVVNFDLFVSIWAKAIIVALVVGVLVTVVVRLARVIK